MGDLEQFLTFRFVVNHCHTAPLLPNLTVHSTKPIFSIATFIVIPIHCMSILTLTDNSSSDLFPQPHYVHACTALPRLLVGWLQDPLFSIDNVIFSEEK